jgi:hypothetical protein
MFVMLYSTILLAASTNGLRTLSVGEHFTPLVEIPCPLGSGEDSDPIRYICAFYRQIAVFIGTSRDSYRPKNALSIAGLHQLHSSHLFEFSDNHKEKGVTRSYLKIVFKFSVSHQLLFMLGIWSIRALRPY